MIARTITFICCLALFALLLFGCSGNPQATAKYYWSDKPQEERVPVSNQADPAGAPIAPIE
ncbi:MAG: hypothetical protein NTV22_17600 [bacterium]|nr:hypothetical protein [bacterium]